MIPPSSDSGPLKPPGKSTRYARLAVWILLAAATAALLSGPVLRAAGWFLVVDTPKETADALVVLNSGSEYYPRLLEAVDRFHGGQVRKIVLNGNRKTPTLRQIEADGFLPGCPWDADSIAILQQYGVPRDAVITMSVEDAYDTISEARAVGDRLVEMGISSVLVVTSKYHSHRAGFIWKNLFRKKLDVYPAASRYDPYDPDNWWSEGRQVRWVMAEYGAWIFLGIQWLQGETGRKPLGKRSNSVPDPSAYEPPFRRALNRQDHVSTPLIAGGDAGMIEARRESHYSILSIT